MLFSGGDARPWSHAKSRNKPPQSTNDLPWGKLFPTRMWLFWTWQDSVTSYGYVFLHMCVLLESSVNLDFENTHVYLWTFISVNLMY